MRTDDALPVDNPADNVGGLPVAATDDDNDTLAYTLGGRDKDMFRVRANGQLEVSDKANLDFETKTSHTVTVIADDNFGGANSISTITVTIYVTDVDEPPTIADAGDPTVKDNRQSVMYAEDRTDPVLTLSGEDPEGVSPIVWSIFVNAADIQDIDGDGDDDVEEADAADGGLFKVNDDGELTFKTSPSFESPGSIPGETNTYKVVVQASDGGVTDKLNWFKVTVNVTDVEEEGSIAELSPIGVKRSDDIVLQPSTNWGSRSIAHSRDGPRRQRWRIALTAAIAATDARMASGTEHRAGRRRGRLSQQLTMMNATYTPQDTAGDIATWACYLRVVATYD